MSLKDIVHNISLLSMITGDDQIECFDVPGTYNDMKKDGVSYYLIEGKHAKELKELCAEHFSGRYTAENDAS